MQQKQRRKSGIIGRQHHRTGKSLSTSLLDWHSIWPCLFGPSSNNTKGRDITPPARGLHIWSSNRNDLMIKEQKHALFNKVRWETYRRSLCDCKIYVFLQIINEKGEKKTGSTYSALTNVANGRLKNQPKNGRSWPWKPTGRAPWWAAEPGRGAASSGSSKLEVSSSVCSAGTKGGRTAGERMRQKRGKWRKK